KLPIHTGVPQGSILGPLLFLVYINDLSSCINFNNSSVIQFADDSTVLCGAPSIQELQDTANELLHRLNSWVSHNRMAVNVQKTHIMIFSPSMSLNTIKPIIQFNNATLSTVDKVKILGVTFDPKLTFKEHVTNLRKT